MDEEALPEDWKLGNITPIYKGGKRQDRSNYRPVSLTSVVCKIFEKCIRDVVMEHMVRYGLLSDCQHGFINGRSCVTQLLSVMDTWTQIMDAGGSVDCIYLDFRKAFDSVPHKRLITKLEGYGIRGKILGWIKDFLAERKQRVIVNGEKSEWSDVISGIPQGSVLGPVLFVIYINDMPEVVHSTIKLFADDAKIFKHVSHLRDNRELQEDLRELEKWATTWQLRFNQGKCKRMHMGSNNQGYAYTMRNEGQESELTETEAEKDLGIIMDNKLKFNRQCEKAVNTATGILAMIRRSYTHLDGQTLKLLYTSLVRPHLEYGNAVWSPSLKKDCQMLEKVQHRATKMVPEIRGLPYEQRLARLDLPSLYYRRARGDMIETYKYLQGIYKVAESPFTKDENSRTRGNSMKITKDRAEKTLRRNYLCLRVVNAWNSLPDQVVTAPTLNTFKARLDQQWQEHRYAENSVINQFKADAEKN